MLHRYRLNYATPGPRDPEKAAFGFKHRTVRDAAKKFMAFRQAVMAEDQSVDTFMRRGEAHTRFHYFGEGETP